MRAMEKIGVLVGVFAFTVAAIYAFWTSSADIGIEWVGVIGLILGGAARLHDRLVPLDDPAPSRARPLGRPAGGHRRDPGRVRLLQPAQLVAAVPRRQSAAICFLGLAVGWWLVYIGAFFAVPALIGWTFEYFKGEHAL